MDKIFKNDKIMGFVAVATLVLVGFVLWKSLKSETTSEKKETEQTEETVE